MAVRFPVLAQELQGAWGQRHGAVLRTFAAPHVHDHAGTVNVGTLQVGTLLQAETTGVDRRQAGPIAQQFRCARMVRTSSTLRITGSFFSRGARTKVKVDHCALEGVLVEERDTAQGNGAGTDAKSA